MIRRGRRERCDQRAGGSGCGSDGYGGGTRQFHVAGRRNQGGIVIGMEWFEGRALCPKRAANEPSFVWSRELLVEGPQAPRADHLWRLPIAAQMAIQRDLGVQNLSNVLDQ